MKQFSSRKIQVVCFSICIFIFSAITINAQTPAWQWARTGGSTSGDAAGGLDFNSSTVSTDALGNSYVTGLFKGTATFGNITITSPLYTAVFVAKYNAAGTCLWAKKFGGTDPGSYGNEGNAIDIDNSGNCYVTGAFSGPQASSIPVGTLALTGTGDREIFIVKYDPNGNELWAMQPASDGLGGGNYGTSIATDDAGNSYVTGYLAGGGVTFGNTVLSGAGAFVVKYDASGTVQWAVKIGSGSAFGLCIDVDSVGNSFVSGYLQGPATFATSPVTTLTPNGYREVVIAKVSNSGTLTWVKKFNGINSTPPYAAEAFGVGISLSGQGNIFLTGNFTGGMVIGTTTLTASQYKCAFVTKLDSNGNALWARQSVATPSFGDTRGTAVKATKNDHCFITGTYDNQNLGTFCGFNFPYTGNENSYVLKIDSAGTGVWAMFATGSAQGGCLTGGISLDDSSNVYISGNHQNAQFGNTYLLTFGNEDAFIAKIHDASAPTGTITTAILALRNEIGLSIYPNPFSSSATVEIKGPNTYGTLDLKIYDLLGQEVKTMNNIISSKFTINRDNLPKGIYTWRLAGKTKLINTGKFVID